MKAKTWPAAIPGGKPASVTQGQGNGQDQGRLLKLVWVVLILLLMALLMSGCGVVAASPESSLSVGGPVQRA